MASSSMGGGREGTSVCLKSQARTDVSRYTLMLRPRDVRGQSDARFGDDRRGHSGPQRFGDRMRPRTRRPLSSCLESDGCA